MRAGLVCIMHGPLLNAGVTHWWGSTYSTIVTPNCFSHFCPHPPLVTFRMILLKYHHVTLCSKPQVASSNLANHTWSRSQHSHSGHTAPHGHCNSELGSSSSHWLPVFLADGPSHGWLLCLECLFPALYLLHWNINVQGRNFCLFYS